MILKAILCVQHFCSFGAMLFTVNLLPQIPLLFVFLVCLIMFVMSRLHPLSSPATINFLARKTLYNLAA